MLYLEDSMHQTTNGHFLEVLKLSKQQTILGSIHALLEWDQETYMPHGAIEYRSDHLETIASLAHKEKTSPAFAKALSKLIDLETGQITDPELSPQQQAAACQWRKDYNKAIKLPPDFVEEFAKASSLSLHAWSEAKRHNDFKIFAPHLEKIVTLSRKKADYLGYKEHPYDALLDLYEPEMTTADLTPLFTRLKTFLTRLVQEIKSKNNHPRECLLQDFPTHGQIHFSHTILQAMGFTPESSRLDLSAHPFCSALNPKDVRMTTRITPNQPLSCLFSVIHEAGHGIYEAQLNESMYGTPLCESISLGMHESQSRLWETFIGKSYSFWQHFYPLMQKEFPIQLGGVPLDTFFLAANYVEPSLIRVESDEVTYCLHVILRFEIEKALIDGSLEVKDLPTVWNTKMREYLGISPTSDGEGCLQDIHWSMGSIGYFPTYALGNLCAAQIFETFEETHPHWRDEVSKGKLLFIRKWLKEQLHQYGRQYSSQEIMTKISGKKLTETAYTDYLEKKFQKIYSR